MLYKTMYSSPVGEITLGSDGQNIIGLWIAGQKYFCDGVTAPMQTNDNLPVLVHARNWLDRYFAGLRPEISDLPLAPRGGEFRQMVWKILCEIPYGQVRTYGDIARRVASIRGLKSMSPQAVGGAIGHNPISIIIPCHRVIGTSGSITGYAAGIETKIKLLEREGVNLDNLAIPSRLTT